MSHLENPFFTLHEGKLTLDFVAIPSDHEDAIRVYANDVLVFSGSIRNLVYHIVLTDKNRCELNFKRVLKLNTDGSVLYRRIHKTYNERRNNND